MESPGFRVGGGLPWSFEVSGKQLGEEEHQKAADKHEERDQWGHWEAETGRKRERRRKRHTGFPSSRKENRIKKMQWFSESTAVMNSTVILLDKGTLEMQKPTAKLTLLNI